MEINHGKEHSLCPAAILHHLTPSERNVISLMRKHRYTQAQIARALGRSQSAVSRELKRNGDVEVRRVRLGAPYITNEGLTPAPFHRPG